VSVRRLALAVLIALWPAAAPADAPLTIKLAADDWCPQHCQGDAEFKGYIVEIVEEAFRTQQVSVEITYLPWLRAIAEVRRGAFDGLLTPTPSGYPEFRYPEEPVGHQEYCFYTRKDSSFRHTQHGDLLGQRLAYLKESGLGSLEAYVAEHRAALKVVELSGGRDFAGQIFEFLRLGRTDVIIMTSDVYHYALRRKRIADVFREAGCLGREKLAVGLGGSDPERARRIAESFDAGLRALRKTKRLDAILAKYGMTSW
jgi:polar amino acid transport system substrate-binding protein